MNWKNTAAGSSALLIEGARRVGKSFIAEEFGKNEYDSYILVDFGNVSKEILDLFEIHHETSNLDLFFAKISAFYGNSLHLRKSLTRLKKNVLFVTIHGVGMISKVPGSSSL
ncbi:MAG: AAA family ATPase, partial [Lachnospiraceae bacterium]|nr:AAA family ATPase [Lachnospiraceae bacterium]